MPDSFLNGVFYQVRKKLYFFTHFSSMLLALMSIDRTLAILSRISRAITKPETTLRIFFITNKLQRIILFTFLFVVNIIIDSITVKKHSFVLIVYSTFVFLCISNVLGMVPYSLTITSHLIITLYFSLAFFIGNNIIGIRFLKQTFFILFLPEGVPLVIIPFLILIEYISYISRIFSLAIRLFANMLSGHILLKILISFIWVIITSNLIH